MASKLFPFVSGTKYRIKITLPQHKAEKSSKNPTSPKAFFRDKNVALTKVASARLPVVAMDMAFPLIPSEKTSDATSQMPGPAPSEKKVTYNARESMANGALDVAVAMANKSKHPPQPAFDSVNKGFLPSFG